MATGSARITRIEAAAGIRRYVLDTRGTADNVNKAPVLISMLR